MSDADPKTPDTAPDATPDATPEPSDERYKTRILIKPNGEVIIENLSMDLVELAMALDPDGEVACDIGELLSGAARPAEPKGD